MKHLAACLAAAVVVAGCDESMRTVEGSRDVGSGYDSGAGTVSGNISERNDGSHLFVLTRGSATCTAVFDEPPAAGSSELSPINCTDGNNGNATVVYGSDGQPDRVVYNAGLDGGGTITF
jgi:hypothetical protein